MRKRNLALILVLALMCALFAGCGGGGSSALSVTVKNGLGYDVAELYISDATVETWDDAVKSASLLPAGGSATLALVTAPGESYTLLAVDTDGDMYIFDQLALKDGAVVEMNVTDGRPEALVTPKKGGAQTVAGTFQAKVIPAPTRNDPLDQSVAMPGYESLVIYYPATMQVIDSNDRYLELDAVNDPDNHQVIIVDLIELGGTYAQKLSAASTAQSALTEIAGKITEIQLPNQVISSVGCDFVDGGSYYSVIYYIWLSGEVFQQAAGTPVRGVLEVRYYGTNHVLAFLTMADEGVIQNYFEVAGNMFNAVSLNSGWTTPKDAGGGKVTWSDPGDYGYYYYDDYDPWSDPGDYGYYYDDYYDPWSDPGDYYEDYYYDDYDSWSDPGDYGYDYYDDYYYDDGEWYESNDADW